ncbi:hypothetical protein XELAEV_18034306mg [Xenopus laevis]|uniref:Uncharacterized protein n=1 Tax=Xenopus laevis TaxID=8355 RepID=A0A974HAZ2_XENLA|nr:hypothetical protein XELAEV_18034306mg [Xenopus laevis]
MISACSLVRMSSCSASAASALNAPNTLVTSARTVSTVSDCSLMSVFRHSIVRIIKSIEHLLLISCQRVLISGIAVLTLGLLLTLKPRGILLACTYSVNVER